MPPVKEDQIDPKVVSFHPNEARKSVFAGKVFLFLEKKQASLSIPHEPLMKLLCQIQILVSDIQ
jgi:hypothetical protein